MPDVTLSDPSGSFAYGLKLGDRIYLGRRPRWRIVRAWRWFRAVVLRRPHHGGPFTVTSIETTRLTFEKP